MEKLKGYEINKGVGKSIEFQGIRGSYFYFLFLGIGLIAVLTLMMLSSGFPELLSILLGLSGSIGLYAYTFHLYRKNGEHGLIKAQAKAIQPKYIVLRSTQVFYALSSKTK